MNSVSYTHLDVYKRQMLAFAISRYKGNLSQVTLIYLLAGQTISAGMIIFPIVIVLRKLGFGSSHAGLILTYAAGGLPFAVFVLQGFFAGIPYELYEAGEIDGAGEFKIFANIAIPLAKPALATVLLYQFMWVWNEFVLAFTIVSRPETVSYTHLAVRLSRPVFFKRGGGRASDL